MSLKEVTEAVMRAVPPDASPVAALLPFVCISPQCLVPEKIEVLRPHLRRFSWVWNSSEWIFQTSAKQVRISDAALNLLWCASYASWHV